MAQTFGKAGSLFQCDYHGVQVSTFDPSWDEQLSRGFCPLCSGSRLSPRLVAKPFEIETGMHNSGYCACCGSYVEPPTAPTPREGTVTATQYTSIAPGIHTIQPDGTHGKFAPDWYEVGGSKFGQFGGLDDET
jgi:hypothetical protein